MAAKSPYTKEETSDKGAFVRKETIFRNFIAADGSTAYKAEPNRYHLYISYACPWAHRTLIYRKIKGLEDVISLNVVDYFLDFQTGWKFSPDKVDCTPDTINNYQFLRQVYELGGKDEYSGRVTVPVLFDTKTKTVVNNESSEVIRMLNSEFNAFCKTKDHASLDLYPAELQDEINELNGWIYPMINNGVYRAGFAKSQEAYDEAVKDVFDGLDRVEAILATKRYLTGSAVTEADIRLFTTLIRFDHVYHGHFKCNKKQLVDYPNIFGYTRDLYQFKGIGETVNMFHIRHHYMESHAFINPQRIVSIGPDIDFNAPHGRENVGQ